MKRPVFSYATEDFELLPRAFGREHMTSVLCICSGGETALNLLVQGADRVVAVDSHPGQLALARLKFVGYKNLSQSAFLDLLGVGQGSPLEAYDSIEGLLPENERRFWRGSKALGGGALWCGSLARYFLLTGKILRMTIGRRRFEQLMNLCGDEAVGRFIESCFQLWRVRIALTILLHPALLRIYYPDHGWRTLSGSETSREFCLRKFLELAKHRPIGENPVLSPMLTGHFNPSLRPPYFASAKAGITGTLEFLECDLRDIGNKVQGQSFASFALCNVMDWLTDGELRLMLEASGKLAQQGARLLMYSRSDRCLQAIIEGTRWKHETEKSNQLQGMDRTGYHRAVYLLAAA